MSLFGVDGCGGYVNRDLVLVLVLIWKPIFNVSCLCWTWKSIFVVGIIVAYGYQYLMLVLVSYINSDILCMC